MAMSLLALAATDVSAFPSMGGEAAMKIARSMEDMPRVLREANDKKSKRAVGFDAAAQYVSNTGAHAFVAPNFGSGDQRGPVSKHISSLTSIADNVIVSWTECGCQSWLH